MAGAVAKGKPGTRCFNCGSPECLGHHTYGAAPAYLVLFFNNDYVRTQDYDPASVCSLGWTSSGHRAMSEFRLGLMNVGGNRQRDVLLGGRIPLITKALPPYGEFQ